MIAVPKDCVAGLGFELVLPVFAVKYAISCAIEPGH